MVPKSKQHEARKKLIQWIQPVDIREEKNDPSNPNSLLVLKLNRRQR